MSSESQVDLFDHHQTQQLWETMRKWRREAPVNRPYPGYVYVARWLDCWEVLRPGEQGFTLDPERNFCAQKQNRSHPLGVRMDRMLTDGRVAATHVGLIGLQPIGEGLHCSDHFGLYADLRPDL